MYQEVQWSKDKQQLKESVTNRSAVQEILKGVLYGEGKWWQMKAWKCVTNEQERVKQR